MSAKPPVYRADGRTPDGDAETLFRQQVREMLDLDWSARDEKIFEELRRLKQQDVVHQDGASR